jgi:hypothetical protein
MSDGLLDGGVTSKFVAGHDPYDHQDCAQRDQPDRVEPLPDANVGREPGLWGPCKVQVNAIVGGGKLTTENIAQEAMSSPSGREDKLLDFHVDPAFEPVSR